MRVLQVMAGASSGGAETIMLESCLELAGAGVEQAVVTRANDHFRIARLRKACARVETASFSRLWPFPTRAAISRLIREFRPDVAQFWMGRAGEFAPAAFRSRSIGWYGGYYKLSRFRNCEWHVGVSHDLLRHIRDQGVPADRSAVIHTFAPPDNAPAVDRASLDTPEGAPVALALARLHVKKGLDTLLEATVNVPGLYVWIAGAGPIEAELKAQCTRLGLDNRVRFLGWRNDRGALLTACNLVAFPSRYEPFGTVTVDAWGASRPLVAADAVGPAAYVKDGVNGLLVPKNDPDALARAMRRIIEEPGLASRLVAGGRASYEEQFTPKAYLRDQIAFLEKIIAATTAPPGQPGS